MSAPIRPFAAVLEADRGTVVPSGPVLERRVSDLQGLCADEAAWRAALAVGDHVVYRVRSAPVPERRGEVPFSITTIEPGAIGRELYMTRGHRHTEHEGELYLGIAGAGGILLHDGAAHRWLELEPSSTVYIPPGWGHRAVNTGHEPFRFLAVYPGAAGHDYESVRRHGLGARVLRTADGYTVRPE